MSLAQADFFDWVRGQKAFGDVNHYELLGGAIVVTPPAGYPHGRIENRLAVLVGRYVEEHRLGVVLGSSQGFELPTGDTLEPDLSFVSTARWEVAPKPEDGRFLRVVPDLVVEILSDKTKGRDRTQKKDAYERAGIREYWIVDHQRRELVLLVRKRRGFARETAHTQTLASSVLVGLEVDVERLFAEL